MIHIDLHAEPTEFDARVRQRGLRFLTHNPNPTQRQWSSHAYWKEIQKELHTAYRGVCAYSCHWISYDTGWRSVEHFRPKSKHPRLAYEWSNYRLVCGALNGRKGTKRVLDPFQVQNGWFTIEFPSLLVTPSPNLRPSVRQKILRTRDILGLNDESTCMKTRLKYVISYCEQMINFAYLADEAPFLAHELQRQNLVALEVIRDRMGYI